MDVRLLLTGTTGATEPTLTDDSVTSPFKASQLFGVDVDYFAGLDPLVAEHRFGGLQVPEPAAAKGLEQSAYGEEGYCQNPGDATDGPALIAEGHRSLELEWIERQPLRAANTASIHQSRGTA